MAKLIKRDFNKDDYRDVSQFYNVIHKNFDLNTEGLRYILKVIDNIPRVGIEGKMVLDAGCGYQARVVRMLHEKYCPGFVCGIDVNEENIKHCKSLGLEHTEFVVGDLDKIELGSNKYDLVICEGVLMYCNEPLNVLKKLINATKSDGHLLLGIYCWKFPYTVISSLLRKLGKYFQIKRVFNKIGGKYYTLVNIVDLIFVPVEKFFSINDFKAYLEKQGLSIEYCDFVPSFFPWRKGSKIVTRLVGNYYYHIIVKE